MSTHNDLIARIGDLLSADAKHGRADMLDTALLREAFAAIRELKGERGALAALLREINTTHRGVLLHEQRERIDAALSGDKP